MNGKKCVKITESEQSVGFAAECKFGDEMDRPREVTFGGACSIKTITKIRVIEHSLIKIEHLLIREHTHQCSDFRQSTLAS